MTGFVLTPDGVDIPLGEIEGASGALPDKARNMSAAIVLLAPTAEPIRVEPSAGLPVTLVPVSNEPVAVQVVADIPIPRGASGDAYDHTQSAVATVWTIPHNLGRQPSVTALSVGRLLMAGEVLHLSANDNHHLPRPCPRNPQQATQ